MCVGMDGGGTPPLTFLTGALANHPHIFVPGCPSLWCVGCPPLWCVGGQPPTRACGRVMAFAGDDLTLPSLISCSLRLVWLVVVIAFLATRPDDACGCVCVCVDLEGPTCCHPHV